MFSIAVKFIYGHNITDPFLYHRLLNPSLSHMRVWRKLMPTEESVTCKSFRSLASTRPDTHMRENKCMYTHSTPGLTFCRFEQRSVLLLFRSSSRSKHLSQTIQPPLCNHVTCMDVKGYLLFFKPYSPDFQI